MADFTKKAIRSSFLKLLNEKPLKQISVKDIVDDCGINRNTFYYHYQDIPALVESIVEEEADSIIQENPRITSIEECLEAIVSFSLKNRKAVLHIYRSVNRDIFEQYQWRVCQFAAATFLEEVLSGRKVSPEDREMLISYIKCISFGVVLGWLESGLQEDIQKFIHRMCELKMGDLETLIERCEQKE